MVKASPVASGSMGAKGRNPGRGPAKDPAKMMTLFVLVVVTLYFGREVLIPITLAVLLAFLLAPLVALFRRWRLGRIPSVLLVVTVTIGVLLGIGSVIGGQIGSLAHDLPNYTKTIETKAATIQAETIGRVTKFMQPARKTAQGGAAASAPAATPGGQMAPTAAPARGSTGVTSHWGVVKEVLGPVLSPLATIGIVFIVAIFALLQSEDLRDRLIRLIGADDIHRTTIAMDDADSRLRRYFLTQLTVNTTFGIVVGVGLFFIGVPNPVLWGVLSALLRFIPYIGSMISALLPIALAAAVEPGWSMALWTAALYIVVEGITGQLIEPLLYGHSTGISPFAVVVAAIFWSWVWGPVGLFLSTPLTLCLVVIGRNVKRLEFLDVMFGDQPALSPVETFYQRLLADDADEVVEQAETLLKDMTLASYYDEVALPGMQLVAADADRGVLEPEQLDTVKTAIYELVETLAEHVEPTGDGRAEGVLVAPAGLEAPAILSIAGRGPLDEPASAMLVHLLQQQGIAGRLVRYDDVSRHALQHLDVSNVAMAAIAYLDISGSPAHLRYLIRRLRRYLPEGTPILVGLWPHEEPALQQERMRTTIGADHYASSFADVMAQCRSVIEHRSPVEPATQIA
ncbi:AI-2E family transporter [Acidiphilium acidophilum]|uniref:AI-2E family transporter n=1 Tax=Acidiphilium acidophilum TaxID=76588 RepID=A0AAW9DRH5_ACIAO|nr:AI-2E family transporter [Acidiphilium acidophilum]MDX5931247.1 AI-2E family transporter [Acidiphilium acidophilum]